MQDNSNLPYAQWVPISGKLGLWQKVPGSVKGDVVCMQELSTKRLAPETHRNHCNFCKSGYKDITIDGRKQCFYFDKLDNTLRSAFSKCDSRGDKLPLPTSAKENRVLYNFFKAQASGPFPLDLKMISGKYVDFNGRKPAYMNFDMSNQNYKYPPPGRDHTG